MSFSLPVSSSYCIHCLGYDYRRASDSLIRDELGICESHDPNPGDRTERRVRILGNRELFRTLYPEPCCSQNPAIDPQKLTNKQVYHLLYPQLCCAPKPVVVDQKQKPYPLYLFWISTFLSVAFLAYVYRTTPIENRI